MWTRKQYMNHECTHDEYYRQFVTPSIIMLVRNTFGADKLKKAYAEDKYLNNIPLRKWDNLAPIVAPQINAAIKASGSWTTLSDCVCTAKAAARIIIEEE